jgi:hypothetical protein
MHWTLEGNLAEILAALEAAAAAGAAGCICTELALTAFIAARRSCWMPQRWQMPKARLRRLSRGAGNSPARWKPGCCKATGQKG